MVSHAHRRSGSSPGTSSAPPNNPTNVISKALFDGPDDSSTRSSRDRQCLLGGELQPVRLPRPVPGQQVGLVEAYPPHAAVGRADVDAAPVAAQEEAPVL